MYSVLQEPKVTNIDIMHCFNFPSRKIVKDCNQEHWLRHVPKVTNIVLELICLISVQFIPLPWPSGSSEGHEGRFSWDPLPAVSAGGLCGQFWYVQWCPLFDVVHPAFPLPTTAPPAVQGAVKDGFGEAVVVCDMPEPCKFLSFDDCHDPIYVSKSIKDCNCVHNWCIVYVIHHK